MATRSSRWTARRTATLATAVVIVGLAVWLSLDLFTGPDSAAKRIAERVRAAGPFGPFLLGAIMVIQCVLAPIPSEPLMMAAGYLYGPSGGFALSWAGISIGASLCFALARAFGREFVERFVSAKRLRKLDDYVAERGIARVFLFVLSIRLFAFTSFDVVSYACGLLPIPYVWFLLATMIGGAVKAYAFTSLGAQAASPAWLGALALAGSFGILLLPALTAWRRRRHRTR